jgi:hypothetical protein
MKVITNLLVVGGGRLTSKLRGKVTLTTKVGEARHYLCLEDVLVVPGGSSFLLSVGKLDKLGWRIDTYGGVMSFTPPGGEKNPLWNVSCWRMDCII